LQYVFEFVFLQIVKCLLTFDAALVSMNSLMLSEAKPIVARTREQQAKRRLKA
jgi:hypothetical protein